MDKFKTRRCVSEQRDPTSQMIRWKKAYRSPRAHASQLTTSCKFILIRQLCSALPCSSPQHYKILSVISLLGNYGNEESLWSGALETACRTHMTTASRIASNMSHFSAEIQVAARTKQRAIRNFLAKNTRVLQEGKPHPLLAREQKKKKKILFSSECNITLMNKREHELLIMGQ